jgi:uncharacterized membrane protein
MSNVFLLKRTLFILSLLGILVTSYLSYSYLFGGVMVCYATGCDSVRAFAYTLPMGKFIPALGLSYYIVVFGLIFAEAAASIQLKPIIVKLIFWISAFALTFSLFLILVSIYKIGETCMWCLVSFCLVTGLFFITDRVMKNNIRNNYE